MLIEFSLLRSRGTYHSTGEAIVCVEKLEDRILLDATSVAGPVISSSDGVLKLDGVPFRSVGYTDFSAVTETAFFDKRATYFNRLAANGVNSVRVWLSHPWSASDSPFTKSNGKYDISATGLKQSYFDNLKSFVADAGAKGIVVTLTLFNGSELGKSFNISPYNQENNSNGIGSRSGFADSTGTLWTKSHAPLIDKVAETLKSYGNVVYQISNEPDSHYMGDTGGKDFHVTVANRLKEKLGYTPVISINITDASQLTATKPDHADDDGKALRDWAKTSGDVGLIELHFVSAHTDGKKKPSPDENSPANFFSTYRGLAKPIIVSNDGDITCLTEEQLNGQPYSKPKNYDRNEYLQDNFINKAFAGSSAWGHVGIEIDDKGLNGNTWHSSNYDARVAHVDVTILHVVKPLQSPTAPTRLTALANSASIDLQWSDNSVNEKTFKIQYSTDGKKFQTAGTAAPNTVLFSLKKLKPNTTYWIRVIAENDFGSSVSDEIKVKRRK